MPVQLTQNDLMDLKAKGFTDQQIRQAVAELEKEELNESYNMTSNQQATDPRTTASYSSFGSKQSEDIARWQLELNDILEKAEHTLRGDIVVFKNGQLIWESNPHPESNTLNENGVRICMKQLGLYINRNTILSDFKEEEINFKVLDFGHRINNLIFMKYDEMGMDTEEKRKEYASLVGAMVDIVHSAYARAKEGGERQSFRTHVNINEQFNPSQAGYNMMMPQQTQKPRGILNPMRYIGGKYA